MSEICQRIIDGFGMPVEWALRIVVPMLKVNGDVRNCSYYRIVKVFYHGMKVARKTDSWNSNC